MANSEKHHNLLDLADSSLVFDFLRKNGINNCVIEQFKLHAIDCLSFGLITEQDLQEMKINEIGPRKRLLFLSSVWRTHLHKSYAEKLDTHMSYLLSDKLSKPKNEFLFNEAFQLPFKNSVSCNTVDQHEFETQSLRSNQHSSKKLINQEFDILKLVVSGLYFFMVTGITSFIMVLAHERLPDISKYPPLPDLFLDNLPHISWAFSAAEWVGVILSILWLTILIFHRYRFVLLRRFFALIGTVFLLRSCTMIITSLSVPGIHLAEQCSPYIAVDKSQRIKRVLEIWFGFGMTIRGIQTCGDYMFSGHTACLTLLNFFITEYAPRRYQVIHTFSWVLNLFGIFFILASHEHYSIDVFVAIYVTSRLFLYYHCLANSNIMDLPDHERTMIWFPLFSFLEYDVHGIVPNVYEIPFKHHFGLFESTNSECCQKNYETHLLINSNSGVISEKPLLNLDTNNKLENRDDDSPCISGDCLVNCRC